MDDEMNKKSNKASFFIELGKPLAKAKTLKETLSIVMYQVGNIFQPVNWSLLLKDSTRNEMVFSVVVGSRKKQLQGMRIPMDQGIVGHIMRTGESLIVKNVADDNRFCKMVDQTTGFQTRSIIGVPLKTDEKNFGVIELINKISGEDFTPMELTVLEAIAEYAAIAIERSYYHHTLKNLALIDSLTGLKNRISFESIAKNSDASLKRYGVRRCVLLLDIVSFRQINEKKGFSGGNDVLKTVAEILKNDLRQGDEIFRYGGDKFVILMPHTNREAGEQIRQRVMKLFLNAASMEEKISFGVNSEVYSQGLDPLKTLAEFVEEKFCKPSRQTDGSDGMEMHIHSCLDREIRQLDEKQELQVGFRKKVSLTGEFKHLARRHFGRIKVFDISLQGIGFESLMPHNCEVEDLLDVTVTLDDANRNRIERRVMVRRIQGNRIDGDFYNPPPFDRYLGFYLMS